MAKAEKFPFLDTHSFKARLEEAGGDEALAVKRHAHHLQDHNTRLVREGRMSASREAAAIRDIEYWRTMVSECQAIVEDPDDSDGEKIKRLAARLNPIKQPR